MDLINWHITILYALFAALVLICVGLAATSKMSARQPSRLQNAVEWAYLGMRDTFLGALGPDGGRHLPLVLSLFFYILFCNLLELIPGIKAATADPSNTLALGILVFFYVQFWGIKTQGAWNYFKHFLGPIPAMYIFFLAIELIGEFVKPISLGMRLFGNIYAEDVMNEMASKGGSIPLGHGIFIPFPVLTILVDALQIFTGLIQAFIFALLTSAYIGMATAHHDDHPDGHDSKGVVSSH